MQSANSLMLFANIYNAILTFENDDIQGAGNILNTLYPNATDTVNNVTISWNPAQITNATYFNTTFAEQFQDLDIYSAFLLDALGKIFESYGIDPPADYSSLVSQVEKLSNQTVSDLQVQNFVAKVVTDLFYQFLISAVAYLAACVIGVFTDCLMVGIFLDL